MAANPLSQILNNMLKAAASTAGQQWGAIKTATTNEFQVLGQRLKQISDGLRAGDMTEEDAADFFAVIRNNAVENLALITALVRAAAQKIVDAALDAAKTGINSYIGFALL
jgi:hypothetical protein